MTTPDAVRAHIEWLCEHGMTQRQIAWLLGVQDDVISRVLSGHRTLSPGVMDHVMRISPDDAELANVRAPNADERLEEEYDHFVTLLGWSDAHFAALMADELDLTPETVMTKIAQLQRRRSPSGLSRSEVALLVGAEVAEDLPRDSVSPARAMEARGFIDPHIWRGKGRQRYAILTEEGAEALRKERTCQS